MALLLVLLLAPDRAYALEYRFEEEQTLVETSRREVKLRSFSADKVVKHHLEMEEVIERTILELEDGRPVIERVHVKKWVAHFIAMPDREPGRKSNVAEGRTFVWRKKRDGDWGLFDESGEVTERHADLVQRLQSTRDTRLPDDPVPLGATWEVDARTFLTGTGLQAPPGVAGRAVFKLEQVEDGIARITFEVRMAYEDAGRRLTGTQKGVWRFDVARGRDVSLSVEGHTEMDSGRSGFGTFEMERKVEYRAGP